MKQTKTPVRALGKRTDEGWIALQDVGSNYLDGAEAWLYGTMLESTDLSSSSTEMVLKARDWAERYHTDPARSNVIRAFDIPSDARVLEVGAGCGAVTRYLGERAALVDAVEPVPARARVARARTRDLDNVEVFVGLTDDIPAVPTYDVVVVVGVLEYVGAGAASLEPYRAFLDGIAARMLPNGTLILAIENKLGAKYFAGAPEDHTGRFFDSLESYPDGGIARTFSRRELESLVSGSGFSVETKIAFPDYKLTRTVLDAEKLIQEARGLAYSVPRFPSFDWFMQRPKIMDERSLWRSFVDAGLAADTGNSLVLIGRLPEAPRLWPENLLGSYYSVGRRQEHLVETRIVSAQVGTELSRKLIRTLPVDPTARLQFIGAGKELFHEAVDFLDWATTATDKEIEGKLRSWQTLISARRSESVLLDLLPQNLLVEADGSLILIDQEWIDHGASWDQVIRRGLLRFGVELAERTSPLRWPGKKSVRDVVLAIGELGGIEGSNWLAEALDEDAEIQRLVACPPYAGTTGSSFEWWRAQLEASLERPLDDLSFGTRLPELARGLNSELRFVSAERDSFVEQTGVLRERTVALDSWITDAVAREAALISSLQGPGPEVDEGRSTSSAGASPETEQLRVEQQSLRLELDRAATLISLSAGALDVEQVKHGRDKIALRRLEDQYAVLSTELSAIRGSTTWRVGSKFARAAAWVRRPLRGKA